jgi:RNA polymerase sigma factor (sigma-70 family)
MRRTTDPDGHDPAFRGGVPFSDEESRALVARYREGSREAFEAMVLGNQPVVTFFAFRAWKWNRRRRIGLDDLMQEGNLGLIRAIQRYDPSRPVVFCTYAGRCILSALSFAINRKWRMVRLPQRLVDSKARRKANVSLISACTAGVPFDDVDHDDASFVDHSPANMDRRELPAEVLVAMSALSRRQADVIILRYGLDGGGERTFEQIASALGYRDKTGAYLAHARAIKALRQRCRGLRSIADEAR